MHHKTQTNFASVFAGKTQYLVLQVGKDIEREVVVEVLFKPEVYVAEVENNDNNSNENIAICMPCIDNTEKKSNHGQLCAGGDELPDRGCGGAGLLREGATHP